MALHPGLERAEWAVFHGTVSEAIPMLAELTDLTGRSQVYSRWLQAVALGACGRYGEALGVVDQIVPGTPEYSMARSLRASLLRQIGAHDLALRADREAMASAATPGAAIEAMTGLAADAVGLQDALTAATMLSQSTSLLDRVTAAEDAPTWWRHQVRMAWVQCEVALLTLDREQAVGRSARALDIAENAAAPRHVAKSLLFLAVSQIEAGDQEHALPNLRRSIVLSASMGFLAVAWPAHAVLAAVLQQSDPPAAHEHFSQASSITRGLGEGLQGALAARWEARADIQALHREALSPP
jgi:tetratricopeptide (TPR) repeat protein